MSWYDSIHKNPDKYELVLGAYEHFNNELEQAREEVQISGNLEQVSASMPGITEWRFQQYQEIEAILELLNIRLRRKRGERFRHYMESYNKQLTTRDAEKYADADPEVLDLSEVINFFALIRNKYSGIIKALEVKGFQLNNITRLRTAGLEDAEIAPIWIPKQ